MQSCQFAVKQLGVGGLSWLSLNERMRTVGPNGFLQADGLHSG